MAPQLSDEEIVEFEAELALLKEEHRDLDGAIEALLRMVAGDTPRWCLSTSDLDPTGSRVAT